MLKILGISALLVSLVFAAIVHSHSALARAEADNAAFFAFGGSLSDICGDFEADHGSSGTHCTLCVTSAPLVPAGPDWRRAAVHASQQLSRPLLAADPGKASFHVLPPARAPPAVSSL